MSTAMMSPVYPPGSGTDLEILHEMFDRQPVEGRRYYLVAGPSSGPSADERIEIPAEIYQVLQQVVEAMRHGQAVTIQPHSRVLTTQQAADLLGVSRPTLVKLLDAGEIPFERAGTTHRRVALGDVLAYAERRRQAQYAAIAATSVGDDDDIDTVLSSLRDARRAIAARRRAAAAES